MTYRVSPKNASVAFWSKIFKINYDSFYVAKSKVSTVLKSSERADFKTDLTFLIWSSRN